MSRGKLAIFRYRATRAIGRANHWLIARFALVALWLLRKLPPDKALDFAAATAKTIGPWFGRHRTALDNLRRAYPEKSEQEIEAIALEMWDNMARLAAEYIFLDQLFDFDPENRSSGRIEIVGEELFLRLAAENRPHILFTAHLGNFELLPIAAAVHGLKLTALFRPPNNPYIADYVLSTRRSTMGELMETRAGAAFALAGILEKGGNVGALVDQKFTGGVPTTFFGRPCETNPVVPMLARRFDCPVHPARCIRLPGNRYRLEVHEALELVRNTDGDIDIQASAQLLNDVVEAWVREKPGQWMWFHKRWALSGRRHGGRWQAKAASKPGKATSAAK
ncbi:MAG: lipid A biosynthesis lauroyl acyltransferase [Pseudomonadota bacterium]|nr:lipid A biosynthesis lauroyl acyltransferase [Pseudomonadota bacterium]MDQ2705420.1 lipid A biosynthesis lauroyl acyltransferase [Pseudomonadota bacterium]